MLRSCLLTAALLVGLLAPSAASSGVASAAEAAPDLPTSSAASADARDRVAGPAARKGTKGKRKVLVLLAYWGAQPKQPSAQQVSGTMKKVSSFFAA